jgi:hypothetical protein
MEVKKHEWRTASLVKNSCIHCGCLKFEATAHVSENYWDNIKQKYVQDEPDCITRQIPDDVEKSS